jgi:hypothetical protein
LFLAGDVMDDASMPSSVEMLGTILAPHTRAKGYGSTMPGTDTVPTEGHPDAWRKQGHG